MQYSQGTLPQITSHCSYPILPQPQKPSDFICLISFKKIAGRKYASQNIIKYTNICNKCTLVIKILYILFFIIYVFILTRKLKDKFCCHRFQCDSWTWNFNKYFNIPLYVYIYVCVCLYILKVK